ncbi:MAG: EamA-like transporter family protein [Moorea sp. SIO4A3]|nr:EamA-like transporter family protein [Moorena sp. SIO4A3]
MNRNEFFLLLISVLCGASGQLFLKTGALKLNEISHLQPWSKILAILTIPELIIGLFFYGSAAITYILLLSTVDLGVAAPTASLVYVFSIIIGALFFREAITITRLFGVLFIFIGVTIIASIS